MILISSSVCQTGLSRQPTSVSICPSCRLQSHAGRCHTLASAPDFHTNLFFYPGTYHPGALWTEYRTHQRRKIRLTSVDAWLNTLFDMSVLIRTWRTALPAFTLHRKVTAIQAVGLTALIKASLRMVAHGGRIQGSCWLAGPFPGCLSFVQRSSNTRAQRWKSCRPKSNQLLQAFFPPL